MGLQIINPGDEKQTPPDEEVKDEEKDTTLESSDENKPADEAE